MSDALFHDLLATLVFAAAVSCGTAIIGLACHVRDYWNAFWLMTGLWGVIDCCIAAFALLVGPLPLSDLAIVLRLNAGLDGLYVAVGALLSTRPSPRWSGFGLAIIVHGLLLMILDVYFWQKCERLIGP